MLSVLTPSSKINWIISSENRSILNFSFEGAFKKTDAELLVKDWAEAFKDLKSNKCTLVWNCLNMTDYEASARLCWQKQLRESQSRIDQIWVVTNSKTIEMGAKLMSMITSYNLKVVSSVDEIEY